MVSSQLQELPKKCDGLLQAAEVEDLAEALTHSQACQESLGPYLKQGFYNYNNIIYIT